MASNNTNSITIGHGKPCPTCHQTTEVRVHGDTWRPPTDTGWYEYWYLCVNRQCETMMIQAPNSYRNPYDRKKQNRVNYMIAEAAAGRIQFASKEATAVATPKTKAPALNLDWENEFDEE